MLGQEVVQALRVEPARARRVDGAQGGGEVLSQTPSKRLAAMAYMSGRGTPVDAIAARRVRDDMGRRERAAFFFYRQSSENRYPLTWYLYQSPLALTIGPIPQLYW